MSDKLVSLKFKNDEFLQELFGSSEQNLALIEQEIDVSISYSEKTLTISGKNDNVIQAKNIIQNLYSTIEKGLKITPEKVVSAIKLAVKRGHLDSKNAFAGHDFIIKTRKKNIVPYSQNQLLYIQKLQQKEVVFVTGPSCTGKTYLAIAVAFSMFLNRLIDKVILAIPTDVNHGRLSIEDFAGNFKNLPYLKPLYDSLQDMISSDSLHRCIENGEIEISPLEYLKGRTLNNAFIIIDEAQKTNASEMKMILSHLGEASKIAVIGNYVHDSENGLNDSSSKLANLDEVGIVNFTDADIIVNPLTAKIIKAYNAKETT